MPNSLASRTDEVIQRYWGSVNGAAVDLGMKHQSLLRVRDGLSGHPRDWFFDAMLAGLDIPAAWFLLGEGPGPRRFDHRGRPIVAGVPTWRRAVRGLGLAPDHHERVLELPFAPWRAAVALAGGADAPDRVTEGLDGSLSASLFAWAAFFKDLPQRVDQADIVHRVEKLLGENPSEPSLAMDSTKKGAFGRMPKAAPTR